MRRSLLALLLLACAPSSAVPGRPADIAGTVTSVQPGGGPERLAAVRIEANPADASGSPKMILFVSPETRLVDRRGGEARPVGIEAVRVGDRVEGWVTGPVAESYPSQAAAEAIALLGGSGR